jgi:uncharacterized repeat protein (TIGR01451 family)
MKRHFFWAVTLLSYALTWLGPAVVAHPAQQPGTCVVTGSAYRDFNADGTRGAQEPPVAGIVVTAYDAVGTVVDTSVTDATGTYTLDALPAADEVRIEFTDLPDYLRYGPTGTGSSTSVVFVTCGTNADTVDIALANPGQYCTQNPDVVTTCFALGDQLNGQNAEGPTVVSVPYDAPDATIMTSNSYLAFAQDTGSTWGLAYRRRTQTLYVAAFIKRHTGLGPDGPGAIYQIDLANGNAVSLFTSLTAANAGETLHTTGAAIDPWLVDAEAFPLVGRRGLGDMSMSDDESTLWVTNLFDRQLYAIPVDNPGNATSVSIPTGGCASSDDARPFAVEFLDGLVYVGVTCTAQASQNRDNLQALVYAYDPDDGGFDLALTVPLDYPRGCADQANEPDCDGLIADWQPWVDTFETDFIFPDPPDPTSTGIVYPQPWLTDIEFDNNGDMILGLRDRFGDQIGNEAFSTIPGDPVLYLGFAPGDLLRACLDGPNNWELEANGSCGGITTGGSGNDEGPGGGEYYFEDNLPGFHDEDGWGSLLQVPGLPNVVGTFFDPIPDPSLLFDGGLRWMNNATGEISRSYTIYDSVPGSEDVFAKANGLGGLEALCPPAPIEIGNRVWFDLDGDGIQDPGETPLAGVTVQLLDATGNLVGTVLTNAQGEFVFSSTVFDLDFDTNYVLQLGNPADYELGGPLENLFLTAANVGGDNQNQRDSDAVLGAQFPQIALTTGLPGDNNHTYDFGFTSDVPPASIELIKSVDNPQAQVGDTVVYTYVVINTGSATLVINNLVDDQLGPITVDQTTLAPGEQTTGTSQPVTIAEGDLPLTNIAVVNAQRSDNGEPLSDTDTVTIAADSPEDPGDGSPPEEVVTDPSGRVTLRKRVNPPFAQVGDIVTWTISVTNTSGQVLNNLSITDTIPSGLAIIDVSSSAGNVSFSGRQVTLNLAALNVGQTVTVDVQTRVDGSAFIFTNLAVITGPDLELAASARLVIAALQPATGEIPWWRDLAIALIGGGLAVGAGVWLRRRRLAL